MKFVTLLIITLCFVGCCLAI